GKDYGDSYRDSADTTGWKSRSAMVELSDSDGKPNLAAPAPRTSDGRPDLSGLWATPCLECGPSQRLFFDLAKDVKGADVQMTPWAAAIQKQRESRDHVDDPFGYCLPPGVPRMHFVIGSYRIVSTPAVTAFLHETAVGMIFRTVFTDGRPLPKVTEPTWSSCGRTPCSAW
ncbi:MAG: hypothetical protein ACRD1Q_11940, partial [Vicinamibacterales bacterium]